MNSTFNKPYRRPPRLSRIWVQRARPIFFVTICTQNRRPILNNSLCHNAFLSFCESSPTLAKVWVGRYVLMPDHLHVFISAEGSVSLARWVASLKRHLTKLIKSSRVEAAIWQQGFFDHVLRDGETYSDKWKYVYENPIRAGLIGPGEEWPFAGEVNRLEWS